MFESRKDEENREKSKTEVARYRRENEALDGESKWNETKRNEIMCVVLLHEWGCIVIAWNEEEKQNREERSMGN